MEYFYGNIEEATIENPHYRRVIATTSTMQVVLMSLEPNQEIGMEFHSDISQFIRVEKGNGLAIVNGKSYQLSDGVYIVIPPYTWHNIINTSEKDALKLYTIYSPPEHDPAKLESVKQ
jgi:mannose-6-phosphate isomerase-like protein (cupin superfamily)